MGHDSPPKTKSCGRFAGEIADRLKVGGCSDAEACDIPYPRGRGYLAEIPFKPGAEVCASAETAANAITNEIADNLTSPMRHPNLLCEGRLCGPASVCVMTHGARNWSVNP